MSLLRVDSHSVNETIRFGFRLGRELRGGDLLAIRGELGSGKTVLTKGIAAGLGLEDTHAVTSPTFVLVHQYECGRVRLNHLDAYRLSDAWDLISLGVDDLLTPDAVTVIEWPERVQQLLCAPHLAVSIRAEGPTRRRIATSPEEGFSELRFQKIRGRLEGPERGPRLPDPAPQRNGG